MAMKDTAKFENHQSMHGVIRCANNRQMKIVGSFSVLRI